MEIFFFGISIYRIGMFQKNILLQIRKSIAPLKEDYV
jgi:hypothetical protein